MKGPGYELRVNNSWHHITLDSESKAMFLFWFLPESFCQKQLSKSSLNVFSQHLAIIQVKSNTSSTLERLSFKSTIRKHRQNTNIPLNQFHNSAKS